jgi:two-component system, OmpR family, osmolarity sensor histidine kinase EnvZ
VRSFSRRPAPRQWSLVRRLTGGVALIALLAFGAQAIVLWLWLAPVADDLAGIAAEQAVMAQAALRAVPPAQRAALAEKMTAGGVLVTSERPPASRVITELPPLQDGDGAGPAPQRSIVIQFQGRPGEDFAATFRLPVEGEDWWLMREYRAARGAVSGTLAVWLVMLALATLGALLVSVQLIARPFGRLAAQISRQQGLLRPLPEIHDGSAELQALVQAFNTLALQVMEAAHTRQQLLAGVSHDLRTPLARLRLRAETQCEPEVADALTADLRALERIVDQFLAYVQGDSAALAGAAGHDGAAAGRQATRGGALEGSPDPVSNTVFGKSEPLHQVVRDVVALYADGPQRVSCEVEDIERPVPDLALQRLLANLIDNALAYGRAPVQVQLRALPPADGGGCELRVMDDGEGMTEKEFQRAQAPFVRLTGARSQLGHCGLGLAIVAQMARQLGGKLHTVRDADGRFGIVLHLPAPSTAGLAAGAFRDRALVDAQASQ